MVTPRTRIYDRYRIEVPGFPWVRERILRISAQLYNTPADYERLAAALVDCLGPGTRVL